MSNFQFFGQGQSPQPVATFDDIQKLIMVLPGKKAKQYRMLVIEKFKRWLAGDETLVSEVRANAKSTNPLNVIAREDVAADRAEKRVMKQTSEDEEEEKLERNKRRAILNAELDVRLAQLHKETNQLHKETSQLQTETLQLEQSVIDTYQVKLQTSLPQEQDPTMRRLFADFYKNIIHSAMRRVQAADVGQKLLTNGDSPTTQSSVRLRVPISDIHRTLTGHVASKAELMKIGKLAAAKYRSLHGSEPEKVEQFVDGATRLVNAYNLEEHPWLRALVEESVTGGRTT